MRASAIVSGLPLVTKPMTDAPETDPRCFPSAGAGGAVRAVHLFGGAANSEVAARRIHRGLGADLDEIFRRPVSGCIAQEVPTAAARRAVVRVLNISESLSALKILVIPGSLRTGSLNAKLAATIAAEFAQAGVDVTRISLGDFPLPIYDGDLQAKSGCAEIRDQS